MTKSNAAKITHYHHLRVFNLPTSSLRNPHHSTVMIVPWPLPLLYYFHFARVSRCARSSLSFLASRQTRHSLRTTRSVTFETNLAHIVRHGVFPTGCSPTRRPHAWQTSMPRLTKHMLVLDVCVRISA